MTSSEADTAALLAQAAAGDLLAKNRLLERHGDRLLRMTRLRSTKGRGPGDGASYAIDARLAV
jgi:hypothetical protein